MNNMKGVFIGFIAGVIGMGATMWLIMPHLMLTTHESRFADIEQTTMALRTAIETNGWTCPAVRNMTTSLAKQGVVLGQPIQIVELCKATYAKEVLTANPEMSTLMPCAWGVYQKDGKVFITGMNTRLMGKLFGGTIARVMGGSVAQDEAAILKQVIRP